MLFETTTERLLLRRPTAADRDFYLRLHGDERLYRHAPYARVDADTGAAQFAKLLECWEDNGFGYWIACDTSTGMPLGWAGVRPATSGALNLYYRFAAEAHGQGLAREAARAAVTTATEWLPGRRIEAVAKVHNDASIRTARSAGLLPVGTRQLEIDPPGSGASMILVAPQVVRVDVITESDREALIALWMRVNDSGGSVGFLPGAPRARVEGALVEHGAQMAAGRAFGVALRDPDGTLAGWAWWVKTTNPLLAHVRWLYRLMVSPERQGRNLGSILMAGLIGCARADRGELLRLDYRSGGGLGDFYARFGFTEVGRVGGGIRVAPGDERDEVSMARRTDGAPLTLEGRT
ncbi:MAG: GNAT family N-acetyltransferase [Tetrasphaera sp.]